MIELKDIVKRYTMGDETIYALNHVSLRVDDGEYVAIVGPSGSGKSTLMNIIGCLDTADSGTYLLEGKPIGKYRENQLARIRNRSIGFIFQGFNLLPKLTAYENVELPLIYQKLGRRERHRRCVQALTEVGLENRMTHRPHQMSGGQQQRCAIARALAAHPGLILADEPTGNLDRKTGQEIMALFDSLHGRGNTIILITHDPDVAARAQRRVRIEDGRLMDGDGAAEESAPAPDSREAEEAAAPASPLPEAPGQGDEPAEAPEAPPEAPEQAAPPAEQTAGAGEEAQA